MRNTYNINNSYLLSKSRGDRKEIVNSIKTKSINLSIPIGRNTNKSLISSKLKHISTNIKSNIGKNKLIDYKVLGEKKQNNNKNIINKFKILNKNIIFNKNSIINNRPVYNNRLIKNKIRVIINKKPIIKRIINTRKHKCKIELSEMVKKNVGYVLN